MNYNWQFDVLVNYMPALIRGLAVTLYVTAVSVVIGTLVGGVLSLMSGSRASILTRIAGAWVSFFLSVPIIVLIFWIYYCLPVFGINISNINACIAALALSLTAFVCEILKSGYKAIPRGQIEVAKVFGFSPMFINVRIIWPQTIRICAAPLMVEYISTLKLSTIASVIAVQEVFHTTNAIISETYRVLEAYSLLAVLFAITILPIIRITRFFERAIKWKI